MKDFIKKSYYSILIWGLIIGFSVLYFSLIFNINVTTDEIYSLNLFKMGVKGMIETTRGDIHPPLYYLYGYLFELISPQNIHLQKVAAIIPTVGAMALIATVLRKRIGDLSTLLTLLFFACVPCTMEYAVQLRMYSLSMFFVTLCGIFCYTAYTENRVRDWVLLGIGFVGAAYTVYFALVAVCFEVGILFLFIIFNMKNKPGRMKNFIICAVLAIIFYTPWIPIFIEQTTRVRGDYYLPPITWETIWGFFTWTFDLEIMPGFVYVFIVMLVAVGIMGIIHACKKSEDKGLIIAAFMSMLIPTLTTLAGVIVSLSQDPIYEGRYVIIEMMMLAIFFGVILGKCLEECRNQVLSRVAIALTAAVLLFTGAAQYYECFRQEYRNHLTQETIDFFADHLGPNDYVLYNYEAMGFDYRFYFPNDRLFYVRDFDFENTDYENIWFMSNLYEWPITDADCYTYWISYEYIGTYGVEDNNFDLYRYYHNDFPKIEVTQ